MAQINFEDAIKTFELLPNLNMEHDLLDFAIYIALYLLQLCLYQQALEKKAILAEQNISEIKCGNWRSVIPESQQKVILKYLEQIFKLKAIQVQ